LFSFSASFIDKNDGGLSLKTLFRHQKDLLNPQNSLLAKKNLKYFTFASWAYEWDLAQIHCSHFIDLLADGHSY
jgi:hypothetical protein